MNSKSSIFDSILNTIESEDIRKFAERCIKTIPDYFWNVGASSTGKYHPQYALGDLGLARHTCALVRFLNHIMIHEKAEMMMTSQKINIQSLIILFWQLMLFVS